MMKPGRKPNPEAYAAKHGKNCKACGTWFVYKDRFYCSTDCRKSVVAKPVEFTCRNCGKNSTRHPHNIKNPKRMFCNKECQNAFQKAKYEDYQNISLKPISEARSTLARSRWYVGRRKERRKNSQSGDWWSKCLECSSRIMGTADIPEWNKRCASASSMMKRRREPIFRLETVGVFTWDKTIAKNRKSLWVDDRPKEQIEWSKKINHTVRSCKRRFVAKNKNATGRYGTNTTETLQGLLPFAE